MAEPESTAGAPSRVAAAAARELARLTGVERHDVAVVLGSGWGGAVDALGSTVAEFPVAELPGFLPPVAPGHTGTVRSTELAGRRVLVFLGRTHLYEGHGPRPVVHAVRTAAAAGATSVLLTNANGSLRSEWGPGTGVVVSDHLNLSSVSPLEGAQFVDLTDLYTPRLRRIALAADPELVEGVYAMLPGPHYETQAEARMIRAFGGDVIGMSTVLEAIAARAAGLDVFALSVVTTVEIGGAPIDPDEVVRIAEASATRLGATLAAVVSADRGDAA